MAGAALASVASAGWAADGGNWTGGFVPSAELGPDQTAVINDGALAVLDLERHPQSMEEHVANVASLPAGAQEPAPTGELRGVVVDDGTDLPIANALWFQDKDAARAMVNELKPA